MTAAEKATEALRQLREQGWSVAVHNDYRQDGERHTFWLLTHPSGRWIKGEGKTDDEALAALATETATVPPDREALARKCLEYADAYAGDSYDAGVEIIFREAAAALRTPASEEVEALAQRLDAHADYLRKNTDGKELVRSLGEAAALLRRLSPVPLPPEVLS